MGLGAVRGLRGALRHARARAGLGLAPTGRSVSRGIHAGLGVAVAMGSAWILLSLLSGASLLAWVNGLAGIVALAVLAAGLAARGRR